MININELSEQHVMALARLGDPQMVQVIEMLRHVNDETKASLVKAGDMVSVHRLQGRAEAYENLLRSIEDARRIVAR